KIGVVDHLIDHRLWKPADHCAVCPSAVRTHANVRKRTWIPPVTIVSALVEVMHQPVTVARLGATLRRGAYRHSERRTNSKHYDPACHGFEPSAAPDAIARRIVLTNSRTPSPRVSIRSPTTGKVPAPKPTVS